MLKAGNVELGKEILSKINLISEKLNEPVKFMHICGTHEYTLAKNGVRTLLPKNVEVISGPGCPVCVCPTSDIDIAIELSKKENVIITTFGDMMRVPASKKTMFEAKAEGGDIRVVYGPNDAVKLAKNNPNKEIVFFSIGFETTAPLPAIEIANNPPENFSIICANKLVPPAFDLLLQIEKVKLDGFILPGHVSAILGSKPYIPYAEKYKKPMVVAGFEVNDMLISLFYLLKQHLQGKFEVENTYTRVVTPDGNLVAKAMIDKVFVPKDSIWRGLGSIKDAGLYLRPEFEKYDAIKKFEIPAERIIQEDKMPSGCLCSQVLMGRQKPQECPLFDVKCTPQHPIGPCMVSHEGTCKITHMFKDF